MWHIYEELQAGGTAIENIADAPWPPRRQIGAAEGTRSELLVSQGVNNTMIDNSEGK